jgi:hypothetical protein
MTTTLCPSCHHRPAERFSAGFGACCHCKCHDVADAAPELLAACKRAVQIFRRAIHPDAIPKQLLDAIARAEGTNTTEETTP